LFALGFRLSLLSNKFADTQKLHWIYHCERKTSV
jgi:hypothetical protein